MSPSFVAHADAPAYEQEADRIAEQVTASSLHAVRGAPAVQRLSGQANEHEVAAPADVTEALAASGRPLEPALRQHMERRFGHDFSRIRVHSDAAAEQSARGLNARAYTVGRDILFAAGQLAPGTQHGRRLIAHELAHVVQQSGATESHRLQRSPIGGSAVGVESQRDKPADQIVRGVTYHAVWDAGNEVWDFVDDAGRSLYSSTISGGGAPGNAGPSLAQFWSAVAAVGVTERAKKLSDEAVARLMSEQGPKLEELQKNIDVLEKKGWQEDLDGQTRRLAALNALKAQRQEVLDAYDPGHPHSSQLPPGVRVPLPSSTSVVPLQGPHELSPLLLDPQQNATYAPDIVPDQGVRFGTHGGVTWSHVAVRSSVGDAYAYNIETDALQVANDLERVARAGYTEIHIATGTHGTAVGGLLAEVQFLQEDAPSIRETMQRNPGLKIITYDMADPVQVASFDAAQALAADGKLPGGATVAAFCYSRTRVLDPNPDPAGPYASTEVLQGRNPSGAAYLHGGLSVGFGALSVYSGLQDPNRGVAALKIAGGGAQIIGGTSYAVGYATDAVGAVRFGSRLGAAGGYVTAPLVLVDVYRDMRHKFDPGVEPLKGEEAVAAGLETTMKLASVFFWEAAVGVIALEYGVKPIAKAGSEYLTPMFVGAISEAYGVPAQYVWGMQ